MAPLTAARPDHKALHIHTHTHTTHISLPSCERVSKNSFIWVSGAEKKGKVARRSLGSFARQLLGKKCFVPEIIAAQFR
jgi:hypothetical protein